MDIKSAFEESLTSGGHVRDPAQVELIGRLSDLQRRITQCMPSRSGLLRRLSGRGKSDTAGIAGLYIWGGVGRGKTFLMDLFFETLAIEKKRRIHFHRMMQEVHARLLKLDNVEDPLDTVAADIARETRVLCFDEFFVSDIGDAMMLGRLLEGLFQRGVTLVATSNVDPDDLYKDGLQRQQFLPAIEQIKRHTDVVHMDSGVDYRLRLLQKAGTYLTPDDDVANSTLNTLFKESATSQIRQKGGIEINGRTIEIRKCAKGIVWFSFVALCDGPRSQTDYIEIARWYPSVIVSGVPILDPLREDQARRFIALVDEFYDRRVKLIISAASDVQSLYSGSRLSFEFRRTVSRLIEMQSSDYLALPHLP